MNETKKELLKQNLQTWAVFTAIVLVIAIGILIVGGISTGVTLKILGLSWLILSAIWWIVFKLSLSKRYGL